MLSKKILIFQKATSGEADFDELIALETKIESLLHHGATVDGHDFGAGQGNIFIHTDYPEIIFKQIFSQLLDEDKKNLKIASRHIDEEEYQILWPDGETEFIIT